MAKRWAPGCVNATGKAMQKWKARAKTKFTKPEALLLSELCIRRSIKWEDLFRVAGGNFSDGTSFGEELSARVSGPEELRIG